MTESNTFKDNIINKDLTNLVRETDIMSYNETINNLNSNKKKTRPFLSKFEKAKLIGIRIQQLATGFTTDVDLNITGTELYDIAIYEIKEKKLPYIIRRYLPNGTFEDWTLDELN